MGRLIDADNLIEWIKQQRKEVIEARASGAYCCSITSEMFDTMKENIDVFERRIKGEPTAYDLNRVVEQLEDYSNVNEAESLGTIPVIELNDAIKIVEGGGVDAKTDS